MVHKVLLAGVAALLMATPAAHAQQTTFRDRNGFYQGSAIMHGDRTSFRDRNGQFAGSSITHGNTTTFYDPMTATAITKVQ